MAVSSVFIDSGGVKDTVAVLFFNFALRFHYFTFILCSLYEASVPLIQNPHHCYSPVLSTGIDSKECFQSVPLGGCSLCAKQCFCLWTLQR